MKPPVILSREDGEGSQSAQDDGIRWRWLYAAVLINLAVLIALFYAFTRAFA